MATRAMLLPMGETGSPTLTTDDVHKVFKVVAGVLNRAFALDKCSSVKPEVRRLLKIDQDADVTFDTACDALALGIELGKVHPNGMKVLQVLIGDPTAIRVSARLAAAMGVEQVDDDTVAGSEDESMDESSVDESPVDAAIDRSMMLRMWGMSRMMDVPSELRSLGTGLRPPPRFGPRTFVRPLRPPVHPVRPPRRIRSLEQEVLALLNKICPQTLDTIVQRLSEVQLHNVHELELVINLIHRQALTQPFYCETYANMVSLLCTTYPEFPPERDGEQPHNFRRVLLHACQAEFQNSSATLLLTDEEMARMEPEEITHERKRRKDRHLANMKFVGALFVRRLLAVGVIKGVVSELIGVESHIDGPPEEHQIESAVELLKSIGRTLEQTQSGNHLVSSFIARLIDLKNTRAGPGSIEPNRHCYPPRTRFLVQDLYDLRQSNWQERRVREQPMPLFRRRDANA